jgi:hypothetical protein
MGSIKDCWNSQANRRSSEPDDEYIGESEVKESVDPGESTKSILNMGKWAMPFEPPEHWRTFRNSLPRSARILPAEAEILKLSEI